MTPSVGAVDLGDDSGKITILIEQLGGASIEQVTPIFRAAAVQRLARGNVAGTCAFTVGKSHASVAAALTYFKAEYGRMNQKGTLVLTEGAVTLTMANAVLRSVSRAAGTGLRWVVRYEFGMTTIT